MRHMNVPQSPDEYKRMQSGFWTHEYRIENDETVWRCDRRKLDEAVRALMLNRESATQFAQDPKGYLDWRFGEGTGYVYAHKHKGDGPYIDYRFPRWMDQEKARYYKGIDFARDDRVDAMAYWNTGTTTNTTTATSGSTFIMENNTFIRDEIKRQQEKMVTDTLYGTKVRKPTKPFRFKKRLVKTLPFKVETGGSLLASLQREFDHWAGDQMKVVNG